MMKVKFKKLNANCKLPIKGSLHAACYDVYASSISFKEGRIVYGLGFATEIPVGYKGIIVPRSNLTKHRWTMNNNLGVIDSDYRGEWMLSLSPFEGSIVDAGPLPYSVGERVAQIYFEKILDFEFEEVGSLEDSERGTGGFGSTGVS